MKKIIVLILLNFCFAACCVAQSGFEYKSLTIVPAQPKPGDKIHFVYHPKYTLPPNRSKLEAEIKYVNKSTDDKVCFVYPELVKTDKGWEGNYQTHKEQRALIFSFDNHFPSWDDTTGLIYDPNRNEGYLLPFYNDQGTIAKGAWIDMACCMSWLQNAGEKRLAYARKEVALNGFFNQKVEDAYYSILLATKNRDNGNESEVKGLLNKKMAAGIPNEERYTYFINTFKHLLKDGNTADSLLKVRNALYPNGDWMIGGNIERLFLKTIPDVDSMLLLYAHYKNLLLGEGKTADAIDKPRFAEILYITNALGRSERWPEFYQWLEKNTSFPKFQIENAVVKALLQNGKKDAMVLQCAALGNAGAKKYIEDKNPKWLELVKREGYDDAIRQDRKMSYAKGSKYYLELLLANGQNAKAAAVAKEAMEITKGEDASINEFYARAVATSGTPQKTLAELAGFFKNGKGSANMKAPMKTLWLASNKPAAAFEPYFDTLNNYVEIQLRAKLQQEMINEPAPAFALKNMDGQEVSLAALKGKPVVLDFWATWCAPCKASMPSMKKAIETLASKKVDAAFLFVDTWEKQATEEMRQKDVTGFMADKKYPFNVLYDEKVKEDFATVTAYKVSGIPTKFIIDSKGNIRFKVTGFGDNEDEVVRSIALMIKMAEEN